METPERASRKGEKGYNERGRYERYEIDAVAMVVCLVANEDVNIQHAGRVARMGEEDSDKQDDGSEAR